MRAVTKITEDGFVRKNRNHVHARPGDTGVIVFVSNGWLLVRWARTGTACDCDASELEPVARVQRVAA